MHPEAILLIEIIVRMRDLLPTFGEWIKGFGDELIVNNKVNLELKVPVTNPNGYKIKITSMDLDVTINGKYLGKMKNAEVITIPKKSDEIHNFPVNIYVKNLLGSMSVLYKMRKMKSFEMQIEGTIKVKAMLRSKTIEVSEKQRISL